MENICPILRQLNISVAIMFLKERANRGKHVTYSLLPLPCFNLFHRNAESSNSSEITHRVIFWFAERIFIIHPCRIQILRIIPRRRSCCQASTVQPSPRCPTPKVPQHSYPKPGITSLISKIPLRFLLFPDCLSRTHQIHPTPPTLMTAKTITF